MSTRQAVKDPVAVKLDAEMTEAEERLNLLEARAEARKAKADMDEISGLNALKDKVKKDIAGLKQFAAADYAQTKKDIEGSLAELKAGIRRLDKDFEGWDEARARRFDAQLDAADAQLAIWKARADQKRAERTMKAHDELKALEEKIALARARAAEAKREKYSAGSRSSLEEAARHFDEAYDAAHDHYEKQ